MAPKPVVSFCVASAALLAACAGAPPPRVAGEVSPPVWPPPPATPRVRWVESLPRAAPPAAEGIWRRAARAILGLPAAGVSAGHALQRPFGVAARGGRIYVADPDAPGVFTLGAEGVLEPLTCKGHDWSAPMGIAAGPDGSVVVADAGAAALVRRDARGDCRVFGEGALERPTGVALAAGLIFVVDPPAHRVVAFHADGRLAARFGESGEGPGQLDSPSGIGLDAGGHLLVVDALNFRIARFTTDGEFISAFGERGDADGLLARPKDVALDERGRIYVSDAQRDRVLVYSPEGAFDLEIGESGSGPGDLTLPAGIDVDGKRLVVADSGNRRIEVYEIAGDAP